MFDLNAVSISGHERTGANLWLAEVVATLGLALVIFGSAGAIPQSGRRSESIDIHDGVRPRARRQATRRRVT
jgi:hypothetical protein